MNILAVDTAGKTAGVALLQGDRLLYPVFVQEIKEGLSCDLFKLTA